MIFVAALMINLVTLGGEAPVAVLASEGLLAGVGPKMMAEARALSKATPATYHCAFIKRLCCPFCNGAIISRIFYRTADLPLSYLQGDGGSLHLSLLLVVGSPHLRLWSGPVFLGPFFLTGTTVLKHIYLLVFAQEGG